MACLVAELPNHVMDTFCWIHSTFSVPTSPDGVKGHMIPHVGVRPMSHLEDGEQIKQHKYYQWVCFTLFFQVVLPSWSH